MVYRFEEMTPTVVIDLDGTLLDCNTFRRYIMAMSKTMAVRCHIYDLMVVVVFVVLRGVRVISHARMKRQVLKTTGKYATEEWLRDFSTRLFDYRNNRVLDVIRYYKEKSYGVIIATAAPANYATWIADRVHVGVCLATPMDVDDDWEEFSGERKLEAVMQYLNKAGGELTTVVTDHYDDLPLLKYNLGRNIIISPSKKTLRKLEWANVRHEIAC
ncbi:HAD family hydrolase [uncultured Muribaculum sp.]|uniref:HAD family hydrolase n=1 Tax=uncultured Muribaculum sp. TaxID=1918613 RepID=UPI00259237EC|nr:HAD family hydrolase [uncultured Muribaculum sp.]